MEIQAAVSKVDRYSSPEQGDKVEIIERPNGGISIVMAEGKLNGRRSKALTMKAVHNILTLISEGIHDCAASRVVLSNISREHRGKAEVNLSIISCDLESGTIVLTKNNPVPVLVVRQRITDLLQLSDGELEQSCTSPSAFQFEIEENMFFILVSDGVFTAGRQASELIDLRMTLDSILEDGNPDVQEVADFILNQAIGHDIGRPKDDMTVIVLKTSPSMGKQIRREYVCFPIGDTKESRREDA